MSATATERGNIGLALRGTERAQRLTIGGFEFEFVVEALESPEPLQELGDGISTLLSLGAGVYHVGFNGAVGSSTWG